jgi:leucyl aminopeptidase
MSRLFTLTKARKLLASTTGYVATEKFNLLLNATTSTTFNGDILIVPFFKPKIDKFNESSSTPGLTYALKESIPPELSDDIKLIISEIIDDGNFKAETSSKQIARVASSFGVKYVAIVGLGCEGRKQADSSDLEVSVAFKFGKSVGSIMKELRAKSGGIAMPSNMRNAGLSQFLTGFHDVVYIDRRFRSQDKIKPYLGTSLTLLKCNESLARDAALTHKLTKMIVSGVELAKDLVNAPPCSKTPLVIADEARSMAKEYGFECKVLGEEECKALGMGGYLGVQQGK